MKAAWIEAYGGIDQLRVGDWPDPVPKATELLIEVHASSINPRDWLIRSGRYVFKPMLPTLPFVLGSDVAGVVREVGAKVEGGFVPGDRVAAMLPSSKGFGGYAELATVDASVVARLPDSVSFEQAGALPLAGMTALQALRDDAQLRAGQKVVIVGASGGVGHYGVQIARCLDAGEIVGVCSARNVDLARELGCDRVVDYRQHDVTEEVRDADVVFDCIGRVGFGAARAMLAPRGTYVTTVPNGASVTSSLGTRLWPWGQRSRIVLVRSNRADLLQLLAWMAEGRLRSVIDRQEPLDNVAALHEHSRSFRTRGKNLILVRR